MLPATLCWRPSSTEWVWFLVVCEVISNLKAVPSNPCQGLVHGSPRGSNRQGVGGEGRAAVGVDGLGPPRLGSGEVPEPSFLGILKCSKDSLCCTPHTNPWPAGRPSDASMALVPHLLNAILKSGKGNNKILVSILYLSLRGLRLGPLEADLK